MEFSYEFSYSSAAVNLVKQLQQVQGSCILSIDFALKQDQVLGKEFLKIFKQESSPWRPFNLGLLLTMARVQRYEEKVHSLLKTLVSNCIKNSTKEQGVVVGGLKVGSQLEGMQQSVVEIVKYSSNAQGINKKFESGVFIGVYDRLGFDSTAYGTFWVGSYGYFYYQIRTF